jgi:hypothetical protein
MPSKNCLIYALSFYGIDFKQALLMMCHSINYCAPLSMVRLPDILINPSDKTFDRTTLCVFTSGDIGHAWVYFVPNSTTPTCVVAEPTITDLYVGSTPVYKEGLEYFRISEITRTSHLLVDYIRCMSDSALARRILDSKDDDFDNVILACDDEYVPTPGSMQSLKMRPT